MKIALLQMNLMVGDIAGNRKKITEYVREAAARGADLCVTSELAICGYPPRDLLLQEDFVERCLDEIHAMAQDLAGAPPVLVGTPSLRQANTGKPLSNSVALCRGGKIEALFHKSLLPNYDVFDERRYFEPSPRQDRFECAGRRVGVTVCEDIWNDPDFWPHPMYAEDPIKAFEAKSVDCLVNLSASPFSMRKQIFRQNMVASLARKYETPIVFANQVGGNDDLVFDGRSFAVSADGGIIDRAPGFKESILLVAPEAPANPKIPTDDLGREAEAWKALCLGLADYTAKCGFSSVLLGLSGGIDSSLTAAIAVEALGPENVLGVLMPSPYTSEASVDDALALANNLGMRTATLPIEPLMHDFDATLEPALGEYKSHLTRENIQARIRGNLLMAISNDRRAMLLATGNKSELSVGYCTIYGDMNGGFAVLSDVPKTLVFRLSEWLNEFRGREIIPGNVLTKAPSAELAPNQKDQDSLPPYEQLDRILERYVELRQSVETIAAHGAVEGYDRATVERVARLVKISEFKRRQAAPGIKITDRAFGTGWRMPLAARW
ncbi:NAD+ synthase [Oceanidesulfovibrio indonesiensis]|uniref:Glutamine-dependent NAD(+) synthetase n=1 Tax=Oceanidesulfovibrio indonesiensis TaxID=54767 RepID=A0A7M3MG45_9BACT|nr:NAD+ synthase [Oceanidesulfovibrio indonesiensis]TVM18293.1 NAD+ synthase [Oceanidesulfovibrio indonesiensis]